MQSNRKAHLSGNIPYTTAMANTPENLKYTTSHEWVRTEGDVAVIGITDFAQSELGDVVYVDMPHPGRAVAAGDTLGSVESVKTVSDIYAPVSGQVLEVNGLLNGQSELLNSDPYGTGFLLKIKMSDLKELDGLLDAANYAAMNA